MITPTTLPDLGCGTPLVNLPRRAFVEQVMGLPVSVHVRGPQPHGPAVARAVADFFAALREDDARFSTWKPESAVSRIRRGELALGHAGARVLEVADLCAEAEDRTDGAFSGWLPGPDGVPGFDPTGLVKGWAVQQAFDRLTQRLATGTADEGHDVLVSAGGDVVVRCARTDTPDWRIGVEDPRDRSRTLLTVPLRAGAVATSGTAARGAHIIDPRTGTAPSGLLSATVIGPSLTWADVYATAAFVLGAAALDRLRDLKDHALVLFDDQGRLHTITGSISDPGDLRPGRGAVRTATSPSQVTRSWAPAPAPSGSTLPSGTTD